jgi:hypothetical protein
MKEEGEFRKPRRINSQDRDNKVYFFINIEPLIFEGIAH